MSVPVLYEANATDFFNKGLGTLPDALTAVVTEERNGEFIFEMTYPVNGSRADLLENNRIIKADAGHILTDQRFVIKKVTPQMSDDGKTYIDVYAEHISYVTNDLALKPSIAVNGSANDVIQQWQRAIVDSNGIVADSDISTNNSTTWTIDKVQNARLALGGVDGSILDVWGGEYLFDNLHISLKKQRGSYANTLLAYGRNIISFQQEENIENTYTSIYPYATLSAASGDTSSLYSLAEYFVDSQYVSNYPNRKILPVDFSSSFESVKVGTKPSDASDSDTTVYMAVAEVQSQLKDLAQQYITNNDVGIPTVSISVSFVDLSRTSNYADVAPLEQLDLCDIVPIRFTKLGIDTTAKVTHTEWNVLTDSYDKIELGSITPTLGQTLSTLTTVAQTAKQAAQDAQNNAIIAWKSAGGKTTTFQGSSSQGFPTAQKIGDQYYRENGDDTEFYIWDGAEWKFIMSNKTGQNISNAIDTVMADVDTAKQNASTAVETANTAINNASVATNTAQNAADTATAVQQQVITLKGGSTLTIAELESGLSTKVSSDDFDSYRTQTDNALVDKVSSSDFTSYRTQTDSAIQERITSVDAESLVTQTSKVWQTNLTTLQTQVNNSAVGTNLLIGTNQDWKTYSFNNGDWGTGDSFWLTNTDLKPNTDYTFQSELMSANSYEYHVEILAYDSNNTSYYLASGNAVLSDVSSATFNTGNHVKFELRPHVMYGHPGAVGDHVQWRHEKLEKGSHATDYSANPSDNATTVALTAVNTSLTSAINLRVQKNDVINQINVSSESILIAGNKVHITGTTTIDNAVIKSAMIDSLSASKLTAGTIDASLINVINLNANNITAGTLTGVGFHQKSSDMETWIDNNGIHNWDNSGDNVWIKEGGFKVYNSLDEGIFMKGGQLTLTDLDTWGTIATIGTNKKPPTDSYGIIDSKLDIGLSGIRVHGGGGAALLRDSASSGGDTADVTTIGYWGISNGGGFSATGHLAQMGGDTSWVAGIQAGSRYGSYMTSQPSIVVGTANWADTITDNTNVGPNTVISSGGIWLNSGGGVIVNAPSNFEVRSGGFIATDGGSHIRNTQIDNELWVNGTLNVSGAKNAIVKTSKGWAQINAYETAEYYFGDIAKVNTSDGSKVKVMMDSLFLETVNTNVEYHVFVSSYGNGYAWVSEQGKDYFIIESNVPNLEVSYEVKAKRLGYENNRLEIDKDFEDKFELAS